MKRTVTAVALLIIACGAALSVVVMLGLIGVPMTFAGGVMLASALGSVRETHGASSITEGIGLLLEIVGSLGIAVSAWNSAGLAWQLAVGSSAPWTGIHTVDSGELALAAAAWLLLPSLITLGIHLRTGWRRGRLAGWWLLTFSAQPATVFAFMIFAALGAPLTA